MKFDLGKPVHLLDGLPKGLLVDSIRAGLNRGVRFVLGAALWVTLVDHRAND